MTYLAKSAFRGQAIAFALNADISTGLPITRPAFGRGHAAGRRRRVLSVHGRMNPYGATAGSGRHGRSHRTPVAVAESAERSSRMEPLHHGAGHGRPSSGPASDRTWSGRTVRRSSSSRWMIRSVRDSNSNRPSRRSRVAARILSSVDRPSSSGGTGTMDPSTRSGRTHRATQRSMRFLPMIGTGSPASRKISVGPPAFPVLAEEVFFELVGIDDARRSDVGHCPQAAQVRDLVRSELPSHRRSFPYETTYAAEAGSPWRFPWDAGLSDGRPLEGEEPEGPGASVRPFRRWRSPCGT